MPISTTIEQLQQVISELLLQEWEAQGHSMSGKVVKDIEYISKQEADKLTLTGMIYPYGKYQATGAKWPNKRPPIAPLQNWVKARLGETDEKKSRSIAFAIAAEFKKNGMPTSNSNQYSSTGKRIQWIEDALKKGEDRIMEVIREMQWKSLNIAMDALTDKWNKAFLR